LFVFYYFKNQKSPPDQSGRVDHSIIIRAGFVPRSIIPNNVKENKIAFLDLRITNNSRLNGWAGI
jgi:hypothetical protein